MATEGLPLASLLESASTLDTFSSPLSSPSPPLLLIFLCLSSAGVSVEVPGEGGR